ncbi:MAG: acyl--CoA ligase [Solirubrobacteraceae bacterium]|nr:acyl--CoA ligase [Solirubrobacteraceae bacterium]
MTLARNVYGVLDRAAEQWFADRPAVGFDGRTVTFRELRDRSLRLAAGLERRGIGPGRRVAVMMGNRLEWPEAFFALARVGAVCVPVNVLLTGAEVDHVLRDSGADVLVVDEIGQRAVTRLERMPDTVVAVGDVALPDGVESVAYEAVVADGDGRPATPGPDLSELFILYYSSGTTGLPKAATHTHEAVLWNSYGQIDGIDLDPSVRYAVFPSFSWAAGLHNLFLALIWIGGYSEIRATGGASADAVVEFVERSGATHAMLVPSVLRALVVRDDLMARLRDSDLRWVITGAEPVPRSVLEVCGRELPGISVCQGYGLSEFPTIATVLRPEETAEHEGSAGRPLPIADIAVLGDDGAVGRRGRGELLLRSPATTRGYHDRPEQNAEVFHEGWFRTGDVCEIDDGGFVSIIGRTKDMISSGGLNVYPKEIEDVIDRLPGVVESAVVGVPDDRFGETAVAIVVTDAEAFDVEVVHAACRDKLAGYKRPRHVLVRDEPLPRSATAKLLKRELRPWAEERLAADAAATA